MSVLSAHIRLMRLDRPVGAILLMIPGWWGIALSGAIVSWQQMCWDYGRFFVGAWALRTLGCLYNDLVDRRLDAGVERTRLRPLAAGTLRPIWAIVWMIPWAMIGLAIFLTLPLAAQYAGALAMVLVALYPWAKRWTDYPQVILAAAYQTGIVMGWLLHHPFLPWGILCVYLGGMCWTIVYDTLYGYQDVQDDRVVGVRSLALRWGPGGTVNLIHGVGAMTLLILAGLFLLGYPTWCFLGVVLAWGLAQQCVVRADLTDPRACGEAFLQLVLPGWVLLLTFVAPHVTLSLFVK